ncbi:MAG: nitrilase-related carbon-nitrogen hydrolase [Pseudomonadota bacterium]
MRIALAQLSSGDNWRINLCKIEALIASAARKKAKAILFPEYCFYRGDLCSLRTISREIHRALPWAALSDLAKQHGIAILLGGVPEFQRGSKKVFNTAIWIDERGKILARYRKIHLFDATVGGKRYRESKYFLPGARPVVFRWNGIKIGIAICYDLRFPEQFRKMAKSGADWILLPSAFTRKNGEAHWHTLLRARAIENLATVLAPAQTGGDTFGHSAIFGPWGEALLRTGRKPGLFFADVDPSAGRALRRRFPFLKG